MRPDVVAHQISIDCAGGVKQYLKSKGYRRIPGDKCSGTTERDPTPTLCPGHEGETLDAVSDYGGSRSNMDSVRHHFSSALRNVGDAVHGMGYVNVLGRKLPLVFVAVAGFVLSVALCLFGMVHMRRRAGKGLSVELFGKRLYVFPPRDEYWGLRRHRKHLDSEDL